jgi:type I restriction enzyme S subunit
MTDAADFFLAGECMDLGYKNVRDLAHHEDVRLFIRAMWERYAPLADAHFREDAKNHFLERFWEMYLAVTLSERGLTLVRSAGEGPEFYFENRGKRVWIEAVAPGPGVGADRVPELEFGVASAVPTEKILLRFTHALVEKRRKYEEACGKGIVSTSDPYVLAINSRGIRHAPCGNTMPYFVQAFLPFGPLAVAIDRKSLEVIDSHYQCRDAVQKRSGASVSTKAFLDPDFSFCSAVLHSSVDCVNRPVEFGGDFCVLHNPNALHSINESVFSWARQLRFENDQLVESA